jgi:hypothetical protein
MEQSEQALDKFNADAALLRSDWTTTNFAAP